MRSIGAAAFVILCCIQQVHAQASSLNVAVLGRLDEHPNYYSDVWGYAASGVELAILGTQFGTAFIDATDPANLVEVGFVAGASSYLRDIKTFGTHAYIVSDPNGGGGDGLQIVDLTNPLSPSLVATHTDDFLQAHNAFIDVAASRLYVVGTDTVSGMLVFDLANPVDPALIGTFTDYYVHDLYVRNDRAYVAAINAGFLGVLDVSNPTSITQMGSIATGSSATHNAWLTDDSRYCLTTDEIVGGHVEVYDVQNPLVPTFAADFALPACADAIVHNAVIAGELAFVTWYKEGLQILNVSDPRFPARVGYYDTWPGCGGPGFFGGFGVFPLQPSGTIYVTDTNTGLWAFAFNPNYGTVAGTVTRGSNGAPLSGAVVSSGTGETVTSIASGEYQLTLPPGTYSLRCVRSPFTSVTRTVTIVAGGSATVNFRMYEPSPPPRDPDIPVQISAAPNPGRNGSRFRVVVRGTEPFDITLKVWSASGRLVSIVFDGALQPGEHLFNWWPDRAPGAFATGVYFVRATMGGRQVAVCKLVLTE